MKIHKKKENSQIRTEWDRLTWAVDLARREFSKLSKKALESLRDELLIFMRIQTTERPATLNTVDSEEYLQSGGKLVISCAVGTRRPEQFRMRDFHRLQKTFKQIIDDMVDRQEFNEQMEKHSKLRQAQLRVYGYNTSSLEKAEELARKRFPLDHKKWLGGFLRFPIKATFSAGIWKFGNILYVNGPTFDMAVLNLLSLIATQNTDRIIRCPMQSQEKPNPNCKQIFVREGKKIYCSPRCSKIMTQKNWREETKKRNYHRRK